MCEADKISVSIIIGIKKLCKLCISGLWDNKSIFRAFIPLYSTCIVYNFPFYIGLSCCVLLLIVICFALPISMIVIGKLIQLNFLVYIVIHVEQIV